MNRRDFVIGVPALGASFLSVAQTPRRPARVGFLGSGTQEHSQYLVDALKLGMRELGYAEDRDVEYHIRFAMGDQERLPSIAKELVALPVDVVIAPGANHVRAVQRASMTIPIVMATVGDPVGFGFAKTLASPGGNVTGLSNMTEDFTPKMLELLRAVLPTLSRVAILFGPDTARPSLKNLENAAPALGITLFAMEGRSAKEIEHAFARMVQERLEGVVVLPSAAFTIRRALIAQLALQSRMPAIFVTREFCDAGGMMSYGSNYADQIRSTATYVDKILKGKKPADLPIEQPRTLDLTINLKTAHALGITIPTPVLLRASDLIR